MPRVSDSAEADESQCATAFGQLSLDENREVCCVLTDALEINHLVQVRYHGKSSGLHLLIRNDRVDSRLDGGVWLRLYFYVITA